MAAIWSDILGVAPIGVDQDFFDLGGTSVKAIEARVRIEQAFGLSLSLRTFFAAPTIEHLVRQLGVKDDSSEPIVMRLRQGPADLPPLHCLLGIELYQDLALALPTSRTVYGIHIPFLYQPGGDHMPAITEIAARYRGAICAGQKSGPYHLAGLCFGGVIAYEVGRQLEAAGEVVGSVAIIDSTLPDAVTIDWRLRLGMAVRRAVHEPRTMLRYLGERGLRWLQDSKTQMPADKVDLQVDSPEATAAVRRYQPLAFGLRAPLQVFRATGRRLSWYCAPDHLGWAGRSSQVSVHTIASDHLAIVRRPHVDGIAEALQWAMAASDGSPRSSG
jgi:thioesterase domain-containing protein/acyl carrier protein